jgi:hypothetical protein
MDINKEEKRIEKKFDKYLYKRFSEKRYKEYKNIFRTSFKNTSKYIEYLDNCNINEFLNELKNSLMDYFTNEIYKLEKDEDEDKCEELADLFSLIEMIDEKILLKKGRI